jgi:cell wall-associated NlpC family hydrolase
MIAWPISRTSASKCRSSLPIGAPGRMISRQGTRVERPVRVRCRRSSWMRSCSAIQAGYVTPSRTTRPASPSPLSTATARTRSSPAAAWTTSPPPNPQPTSASRGDSTPTAPARRSPRSGYPLPSRGAGDAPARRRSCRTLDSRRRTGIPGTEERWAEPHRHPLLQPLVARAEYQDRPAAGRHAVVQPDFDTARHLRASSPRVSTRQCEGRPGQTGRNA